MKGLFISIPIVGERRRGGKPCCPNSARSFFIPVGLKHSLRCNCNTPSNVLYPSHFHRHGGPILGLVSHVLPPSYTESNKKALDHGKYLGSIIETVLEGLESAEFT